MKKLFPLIIIVLLSSLSPSHAFRDLETGTFLTRDPIGYADGPNVYCYVHCNPIIYFDPVGLKPGDRFESFDVALYDALTWAANETARNGGYERGGNLFFADGVFSYTGNGIGVPIFDGDLSQQKLQGLRSDFWIDGNGGSYLGVYHSHPAANGEKNWFSIDDLETAHNRKSHQEKGSLKNSAPDDARPGLIFVHTPEEGMFGYLAKDGNDLSNSAKMKYDESKKRWYWYTKSASGERIRQGWVDWDDLSGDSSPEPAPEATDSANSEDSSTVPADISLEEEPEQE